MGKDCERIRRVFDLHCDSLTHGVKIGAGLDDDKMPHFSVGRLPEGTRWCQCMAIFVPDALRGEAAARFFEESCGVYRRETARLAELITPVEETEGVLAALAKTPFATILTVEGGAALAGEIRNLPKMYGRGVRMMTLTWNGENELAGGCATQMGFTPLGREVVREMERLGMAVDVSHLSDAGFWELCAFASRPFAASHSNSRRICNHRRNLTDEMFREIVRRGGVAGLNYGHQFLVEEGESGSVDDLLRHVHHFLELGGEDALALGSDFDGTDIPDYIAGPHRLPGLWEALEGSGISPEVTEKILFGNANRFFAALAAGRAG